MSLGQKKLIHDFWLIGDEREIIYYTSAVMGLWHSLFSIPMGTALVMQLLSSFLILDLPQANI